MNTIIEKIRTWVERRLKNTHDWLNGKGAKKGTPRYYEMRGRESAFDSVLSILSDLEKECEEKPKKGLHHGSLRKVDNPMKWMEEDAKEPTTAEGFNEEFHRWLKGEIKEHFGFPSYGEYGLLEVARHFAQWGAEHAKKDEIPVPADLKEAAYEYEQTRRDTDARSDNEIVRRAFKAGAKWGAEHRGSSEIPKDLKEAAEEYSKERAEGHILYDWVHAFIAGAKWRKEQDDGRMVKRP